MTTPKKNNVKQRGMEAKTTKNSPIAVLYEAALQIVEGTRAAFEEQGKDAREIRLPILIHGTGMRIIIEDGPRVAAKNAIEEAQCKANGRPVEPTIDMSRALQDAQMLLCMFASDLGAAHRASERGSERWNATKDEAARCMATAKALKELERLL